MARRVTKVKSLRGEDGGRAVVVQGPRLFVDLDGKAKQCEVLRGLDSALAGVRPDVAMILPAEAEALAACGISLPEGLEVSGTEAVTRLVRSGDTEIGFVLLPGMPESAVPTPGKISDEITAPVFAKAVDAARELKTRCRLVAAISPWGIQVEQAFLERHPGAVDILLGSGQGAGVTGRTSGDGSTLWSRAYGKGKALQQISIFNWPTRDGLFSWNSGSAAASQTVSLDEKIPEDAATAELFNNLDN